MTKLPDAINNLALGLGSLPGIGPKMANRLAIYLATNGSSLATDLRNILADVQEQIQVCEVCGNIGERQICEVCADDQRDTSLLMVVETPMDLLQIEQSGEYHGRYFVLGRLISPLNGVGPGEISLDKFKSIVGDEKVREIILALSPTVEGEATSLFLTNIATEVCNASVSRLARGLPTGVGIEYLDKETIKGALEGRREYARN